MSERSKMRLGAFLMAAGHHRASWRHPSVPDGPEISLGHYIEMAETAERGLFDMLFFADSTAPWGPYDLDIQSRTHVATVFEPITLLSALSMVTKRIGLVTTSTTSFDEPYLVARRFASLDQLSRGRAGWNLVTSINEREAYNFGRSSHLAHADRYDRASEFADVVLGLWDSWDDDAFLRDRASGRYFDPAKMHYLNHTGKHFSVKGPLNVGRSPQGRPILVQAG
jgi:FMN-dependent oxidoreductase (nitrilotriacetate monooxygenase family)